VLCTLKAWESEDFCRAKLNRSCIGKIDRARNEPGRLQRRHRPPFAATGARIVATLAKELAQRGSGRGLISICAAGGHGRDRHPGEMSFALEHQLQPRAGPLKRARIGERFEPLNLVVLAPRLDV
jgi:hypothetical protein